MTHEPPDRAVRVALALPHQPGAAAARRRGTAGGPLVPAVCVAATAMVGFIGGVTIAATQVSTAGLPSRSILSELVPYTLPPTGAAPSATSQNSSVPASAVGSPSSHRPPSAPAIHSPVPLRQGSKPPQPGNAGYPPPPASSSDPDGPDAMLPGIHAQAEQLQEEQLRELAQRMETAIGLAIGLRTR